MTRGEPLEHGGDASRESVLDRVRHVRGDREVRRSHVLKRGAIDGRARLHDIEFHDIGGNVARPTRVERVAGVRAHDPERKGLLAGGVMVALARTSEANADDVGARVLQPGAEIPPK